MKQKILIILLILTALLTMGFRWGNRYSSMWKTVSGGIEYDKGNINISNGTLTISGTTTSTGNLITSGTLDVGSNDAGDILVGDGSDFESAAVICYENAIVCYENEIVTY